MSQVDRFLLNLANTKTGRKARRGMIYSQYMTNFRGPWDLYPGTYRLRKRLYRSRINADKYMSRNRFYKKYFSIH